MARSSPLAQLILIRHGETEWNALGKYMNQLDSPLSPLGRRQVELLGDRMKHAKFDALYCSDQGRAIASAAPISEHSGVPLIRHSGLREQSLGIFAGHTRVEIEEKFPEELARSMVDVKYEVPGGESSFHFHRRVIAALDKIAEKHRSQTVVAVTHGGVTAVVLRHAMGLAVGAPCLARQLNTSLNVFEYHEKGWILKTWGDVSHLSQI